MRQMMILEADSNKELAEKYNALMIKLGKSYISEESCGEFEMKIVYDADVPCGSTSPQPAAAHIKNGTCSACPYFYSRREQNSNAKWGTCRMIDANINEEHKMCKMFLDELASEREVGQSNYVQLKVISA